MKQFTLKDPEKADAGRIQLNALGIASRIKRCFPPNIGNIPRAVLYSMNAKGSGWQWLFFVIAVPFTVLALYGWICAFRRKQYLLFGFSALFWIFVAMWPWLNPRFLVPLIPYILLFVFLAADEIDGHLAAIATPAARTVIGGLLLSLLLIYYARVHFTVIPREHAAPVSGYALGRTKDEAGFYAAAAWLRDREPDRIVMARPAYLMHLYSGHPTTQIEPAARPRLQEIAYILPNHVAYLVIDRWPWSHTDHYLGPYLKEYAAHWTLVWTDPGISGVRVFRRND